MLAQYAIGFFIRKISLKVMDQFAILLTLITIYRAIRNFGQEVTGLSNTTILHVFVRP